MRKDETDNCHVLVTVSYTDSNGKVTFRGGKRAELALVDRLARLVDNFVGHRIKVDNGVSETGKLGS